MHPSLNSVPARLCATALAAAVAAFAAAGPAAAQAPSQQLSLPAQAGATAPPVRVFAWAKHEGCQVRYTYVVQNAGAYPLSRLFIGLYQPDTGEGAAELSVMPRLSGNAYWLAPSDAVSPPGWNVKAYFPDDSRKFALEWVSAAAHAQMWPAAPAVPLAAPAGSQPAALMPGLRSSRFSVLLSDADNAYVQGRANLDYGDASLNVPIEKGDTTAPTLNLDVHQTRRGGDWVAFDVRTSVADDYDEAPVLARPTVIANQRITGNDYLVQEKPFGWRISFRDIAGRAYQAQFVVTDASGNATMRSVDYIAKGPPGNGR